MSRTLSFPRLDRIQSLFFRELWVRRRRLETQAKAVEVFAMSDCSDTEWCGDAPEHGARTSRRFRLVWNDSQSEHHTNDGRVASERREVHAASQFVRTVASRVGFVDESGTVPRQLRHQQWSAFNVPLMMMCFMRKPITCCSGSKHEQNVCHPCRWVVTKVQDVPQ